ncbi:MAG: AbrB/MazE/SpoVT family DNA-binding domain-containing protein [Mycobacteriales bacterium]
MPAATVTSKGQVTIPADVRRILGVTAGSRVDFVPTGNGSFELVAATGSLAALKGVVPAPARPVTLEQMDEAIAGAVEDRGRP